MDDIKELQRHLDELTNKQNDLGLANFEGYSPFEMQYILYDTFGENSPIELSQLTTSEYKRIPMLNQIKYLLDIIANSGELKLTAKGFLPTKIVADIYSQGFIKDEMIESGFTKLYKETDSNSINLTRNLIVIAGLAKKRNGKISLTKKGEKIYSDNFDLLKLIIETFGRKFNWAYYDGYGDNQIGQLGFGFSLILLSKYGFEKQLDNFYSNKYFKAFPMLMDNIQPLYFDTNRNQADTCYSLRTFDRFLDYFGLIKIEVANRSWDADKHIIKTELFNKLIKVRPHINLFKK